MKELATPTGDVYKNWDIREDEKIYFLLQCKENEFTYDIYSRSNADGESVSKVCLSELYEED